MVLNSTVVDARPVTSIVSAVVDPLNSPDKVLILYVPAAGRFAVVVQLIGVIAVLLAVQVYADVVAAVVKTKSPAAFLTVVATLGVKVNTAFAVVHAGLKLIAVTVTDVVNSRKKAF